MLAIPHVHAWLMHYATELLIPCQHSLPRSTLISFSDACIGPRQHPHATMNSGHLVKGLTATMQSWPLYQVDIKNAFLLGDLAKDLCMEQPPGFIAQGEFGLVCRLCRSLYGLKQSPRAWFGRFSSVGSGVWYDSEYSRSLGFLTSYEIRAVHLFDCLCGWHCYHEQ